MTRLLFVALATLFLAAPANANNVCPGGFTLKYAWLGDGSGPVNYQGLRMQAGWVGVHSSSPFKQGARIEIPYLGGTFQVRDKIKEPDQCLLVVWRAERGKDGVATHKDVYLAN
jgi:hypothetical protein